MLCGGQPGTAKQGLGGACSHPLKGQWSVTQLLAAGGADTRPRAQPVAPGAQPRDGARGTTGPARRALAGETAPLTVTAPQRGGHWGSLSLIVPPAQRRGHTGGPAREHWWRVLGPAVLRAALPRAQPPPSPLCPSPGQGNHGVPTARAGPGAAAAGEGRRGRAGQGLGGRGWAAAISHLPREQPSHQGDESWPS